MKYLAKIYPIYPREKIEVFELDCLDNTYEDSSWQYKYNEEIKEVLNMYQCARAYDENSDIRYSGNSTWYVGEADNIFEFLEKFKKALAESR
jgi:hypothetical protein